MNIHGSNTDVRKMFTITIRVPYSYRSLGNLVVSREVPCLDGLSRCSRKNKAILRWVFQPIPRPVRFTWDLIYDSGSPTPLKGCVVRVAVHPRCSRPSPVRFTAHCTDTHCPHREEVILTLTLTWCPNWYQTFNCWNERSSPPLATCRPVLVGWFSHSRYYKMF